MFSRMQDYDIPHANGSISRTAIVFFGSRDDDFCSNLSRHAKDHFLKSRWPMLLEMDEKEVVELRQKTARAGVTSEREVANELWPTLGPILDGGIRFSVGLPVFLRYEQDLQVQGRVLERHVVGFYFLASEGFIAVVHDGSLRTAYFRKDWPHADRQSVFEEAWNYLRLIWKRHEREGRVLMTDVKHGQNRVYNELQAISLANWTNCPKV